MMASLQFVCIFINLQFIIIREMQKRRNFIIDNSKEHQRLTLGKHNETKQNRNILSNKQSMNQKKLSLKQFQISKNILESKTINKIQKLGKQVSLNKRRSSLQVRILNQNQNINHQEIRKPSSFYIKTNKQHTFLHLKDSPQKLVTSIFQGIILSINEELDQLANKFILNLINKAVLIQMNTTNYLIKKERLHQLIKSLISLQISQMKKQQISQDESFSGQEDSSFKIQKQIIAFILTQKAKKQKIKSAVQSFHYNSLEYNIEQQATKLKIADLINQKIQLESKIFKLKLVQSQFKQKIVSLQNSLNMNQQISYKLQKSNIDEADKLQKLQKNLNQIQKQLLINKKQEENIFNFVNKQQNNKILQQISQEYKNIESDIYEYAVYLQSNQLASNPNFQPHPFAEMEKQLTQQLKATNRTIMQNTEMSIREKEKIMRDFIVQTVEYYRKKDLQMQKLRDFKTKCIREFVNKMKKWLNNWEFKQQFLVNLRKQFAQDSKVMNEKLNQLNNQYFCQTCRKIADAKISVLISYFCKIEDNYKMGNSFY